MLRNYDYGEVYDEVDIPEEEWGNLPRWFGTNVSLTSLLLTEWNRIQKTAEHGPRERLFMNFPVIDRLTKGILPGELVYIGQRIEKINTAVVLNIIRTLGIEGNKKLLVFNVVCGESVFARSLMSLCSGISEVHLQSGQGLTETEEGGMSVLMQKVMDSDVSVVSLPNICVEKICDEVNKMEKNDVPVLILIDNLRFLTTKEKCKNKRQEYDRIVQKIRRLAKDSGIPIVLTGPLSDKRRTMYDYCPSAEDLPTDKLSDLADKILMISQKKRCPDASIYDVYCIKNPDTKNGRYCNVRYIAECNGLKELDEMKKFNK